MAVGFVLFALLLEVGKSDCIDYSTVIHTVDEVGNYSETNFGAAIDGLGDVDGDGVWDVMVSALFLHDIGAVFILFMEQDGLVRSFQEISYLLGDFTGK